MMSLCSILIAYGLEIAAAIRSKFNSIALNKMTSTNVLVRCVYLRVCVKDSTQWLGKEAVFVVRGEITLRWMSFGRGFVAPIRRVQPLSYASLSAVSNSDEKNERHFFFFRTNNKISPQTPLSKT